jgi:hypothetical protein
VSVCVPSLEDSNINKLSDTRCSLTIHGPFFFACGGFREMEHIDQIEQPSTEVPLAVASDLPGADKNWGFEPEPAPAPPAPTTTVLRVPDSSLTIKAFLSSTHPKDKGIICLHYKNESWCPVVNCPYLHANETTRREIPSSICQNWLRARCEDDDCSFFHQMQDKLDKLKASGAADYSPVDIDLPVRNPADHIDSKALKTSAELCGVGRLPKPAPKVNAPFHAPATAVAKNAGQDANRRTAPPPYTPNQMPVAQHMIPQPMMMQQPMMYPYPQPMYASAAPQMMTMAGGGAPPGYVMMMPSYAPHPMQMQMQMPMAYAPMPMQYPQMAMAGMPMAGMPMAGMPMAGMPMAGMQMATMAPMPAYGTAAPAQFTAAPAIMPVAPSSS